MKSIILLFGLFIFPVATIVAEEDPRAADRETLRTMLGDFEASLNEKNIEKLLGHLDDQAVMSFMTTETAVGKEAVQAYYDKMFKGDDAPLADHKTKATLETKAIFHGDTIIASGRTKDIFTLKDGSIYKFDTRWVASAVKKQGNWKVVSVNFSVDPFENIVMDELQNKLWTYAIMAFIVGLIVAFFIGCIRKN